MATVTVYIVSIPQRNFLNKVIESVLLDPEVSEIVCMLNNYPVNYDLFIHPKVKYISRQNKKGCSEKFYDLRSCKTKYAAFLDDDFTITPGYFARLIEKAEQYKGIVSYHGNILKTRPIQNYYRDRFLYHCRRELTQDKIVDIIGSGACLFDVGILRNCKNLYNIIEHPNMSDIYLSALARANKVPCVVIAHTGEEIQLKPDHDKDITIFDRYRDNCQHQTNFINKYF
jgi:hypothetical protein